MVFTITSILKHPLHMAYPWNHPASLFTTPRSPLLFLSHLPKTKKINIGGLLRLFLFLFSFIYSLFFRGFHPTFKTLYQLTIPQFTSTLNSGLTYPMLCLACLLGYWWDISNLIYIKSDAWFLFIYSKPAFSIVVFLFQ